MMVVPLVEHPLVVPYDIALDNLVDLVVVGNMDLHVVVGVEVEADVPFVLVMVVADD